jgi:hypothetical protein
VIAWNSDAVSTEHALLVRQLTPMLHQVAVPARELFVRIGRDHLHRERLHALLGSQGKDRLLVLFFARAEGAFLGLLRQDLLEARLALLEVGFLLGLLGVLATLGFGVRQILLFFFQGILAHRTLPYPFYGPLMPEDFTLGRPDVPVADRTNAPRARDVPKKGWMRNEISEDPRDLWGRDAGASRSLLGILGPRPDSRRRRAA